MAHHKQSRRGVPVLILAGLTLGMVLSGTTANAAAPSSVSQAQPIAQLSLAQRTSLPATTMVKLTSGRIVSLSVLREEHVARMKRFEAARAVSPSGHFAGGPQLVPMHAIKGPVDYMSYCRAVPASACLYLPAQADMWVNMISGDYIDADEDVSPAICRQEGGTYYVGECRYTYPGKFDGTFNPGTPPPGKPIGFGVTSAKHCGDRFSFTVDPKGSFELYTATGKAKWDSSAGPEIYLTTGSSPVTCRADVYLPSVLRRP